MGWKEKSYQFSFENQPIPGLFFIDGKLLRNHYPKLKADNEKSPTILFPSGELLNIWEHPEPSNATVHIFGEMDLPLKQPIDEVYKHASQIAEAVGYLTRREGEDTIIVIGNDDDESYRVIYDHTTHIMTDVQPYKHSEIPKPFPLLTDELRAKLPKLYSGEKEGLKAIAQVKFFTPDAQWTWYASEFDGDDLFFGLVASDEIELGYFSLQELQDVRGPLGLPIERDRFFEPVTLAELKTKHEQERRSGD